MHIIPTKFEAIEIRDLIGKFYGLEVFERINPILYASNGYQFNFIGDVISGSQISTLQNILTREEFSSFNQVRTYLRLWDEDKKKQALRKVQRALIMKCSDLNIANNFPGKLTQSFVKDAIRKVMGDGVELIETRYNLNSLGALLRFNLGPLKLSPGVNAQAAKEFSLYKSQIEYEFIKVVNGDLAYENSIFEYTQDDLSEIFNRAALYDSAPNIDTKISHLSFNSTNLSEEEKKLLKKLQVSIPDFSLRKILITNPSDVLSVKGISIARAEMYAVFRNKIISEFKNIVTSRDPIQAKNFYHYLNPPSYQEDSKDGNTVEELNSQSPLTFSELDSLLLGTFEDFLFKISNADRACLTGYYSFHQAQKTLEELGLEIGVTRERVRQLIKTRVSKFSLIINQPRIRNAILNLSKTSLTVLKRQLPIFTSCFQSDDRFLELLAGIINQPKSFFRDSIVDVNDINLDDFFGTSPSPISTGVLRDYLAEEFTLPDSDLDGIIESLEDSGYIKTKESCIYPLSLSKSVAYGHVLAGFKGGLPLTDLTKVVNASGCCKVAIKERGSLGDINQFPYMFLSGRGLYKNIKYITPLPIELSLLFEHLQTYLKKLAKDSTSLVDFYQNSSDPIKKLDYYEIREYVRANAMSFGMYFSGKSSVDIISIKEDPTYFNQEEFVFDLFRRSERPLSKAEVAVNIKSKSLGHASLYLTNLMEKGKLVRIDLSLYTTPEKGFHGYDQEGIKSIIHDFMSNKDKPVEIDLIKEIVNQKLALFSTKYFYLSFVSFFKASLGLYTSSQLVSKHPIPYKSLSEALNQICNPNLSASENYLLLSKEIEITQKAFRNSYLNWISTAK